MPNRHVADVGILLSNQADGMLEPIWEPLSIGFKLLPSTAVLGAFVVVLLDINGEQLDVIKQTYQALPIVVDDDIAD